MVLPTLNINSVECRVLMYYSGGENPCAFRKKAESGLRIALVFGRWQFNVTPISVIPFFDLLQREQRRCLNFAVLRVLITFIP
jgi:hypothetical protein